MIGIGNILKGIFPSVERILDETITNKEELQTVLNELKKLENEKEAIIEQEVTKRWESDNAQDSNCKTAHRTSVQISSSDLCLRLLFQLRLGIDMKCRVSPIFYHFDK